MPRHYLIYKYNPKTDERVLLHEMVPEAIADWLREQSERELNRKEKAEKVVILKEPEERHAIAGSSKTAASGSRPRVQRRRR